MMTDNIIYFIYLASAICFILALRGLSSPSTARNGNITGIIGMALAIFSVMVQFSADNYLPPLLSLIIGGAIGITIAVRISMTAMPQLVAGFHSLVGLVAVLVAMVALWEPQSFGILISGKIAKLNLMEMALGSVIGAITFSGSIVAFARLQGIISGRPLRFFAQQYLNILIAIVMVALLICFIASGDKNIFIIVTLLAFIIGVLLIAPVGGADMPVIISMLNSYSGWATVAIGFTLANPILIVTGALVGASGAILSYIMCNAMNRSLLNVMFGGMANDAESSDVKTTDHDKQVKSGSAVDAAFILQNSDSVIIVPGYGMAVAKAQHSIKEMVDILQTKDIKVRFAIHPVAGRMPGHMNVLLAEAGIPYDMVFELDEINNEFASTDVTLIIGANDVTNPAAKTDKSSPLYGMQVFDAQNSGSVLFIKRSMSPGYAGVDNELFFNDNTMMLSADAKQMIDDIVKSLE